MAQCDHLCGLRRCRRGYWLKSWQGVRRAAAVVPVCCSYGGCWGTYLGPRRGPGTGRGRGRAGGGGGREERLNGGALTRMWAAAVLVGMLSGFFGIGGGFLIVPGLLFSTGMPIIFAVGSSLLSVGSFGLTTAVNYAASGLVDWPVAAEYIGGGILGGFLGMRLCIRLAPRRAALNRVFAGFVFAVAVYMLYRNVGVLSAL